jgi:uncharacterized protein
VIILSQPSTNYVNNRILKIQVGFLLSEGAGQSRDFEFDVPTLKVADDLTLYYLRGSLHLSRTSRGILVQGTLDASIDSQCGRCLDDAQVELQVPVEELFVYPPEQGELWVVEESGILDLTPLLREEIILNTPIGTLCRPDCLGLCPHCGKNLNEGKCDCVDEEIDPRFAKLKSLRDSLNKE